MKTAVFYCRVSSEEQAQANLSIPAQLAELERYATQHGYQVLERFMDEGYSAYVSASTRPAFQAMMKFCTRTQLDTVLVWKMDRFARNREDAALYKGLLSRRKIRVVSMCEPLEDNASGRLMEGMLDLLSEFYSAQIGMDIKRAFKARAELGIWPGGVPPFGYRFGTITVNGAQHQSLVLGPQEEVETVRTMFKLCAEQHYGAVRTLRYLKEQNAPIKKLRYTHIPTMLHNAVYMGYIYTTPNVRHGKEQDPSKMVPGIHDPIITPELYFAAQASIRSRRRSTTRIRRRTEYLLTGIIFCSCGRRMWHNARTHRKKIIKRWYRCRSKDPDPTCAHYAVFAEANAQVLKVLECYLSPSVIDELEQELERQYRAEVERLKRPHPHAHTQKQLTQKIQRLYTAIESGGDIQECTARIRQYQAQLQELTIPVEGQEAAHLEQARARIRKRLQTLRENPHDVVHLPEELQRELVLTYVEMVEVHKDGLVIKLRLDGEESQDGGGECRTSR